MTIDEILMALRQSHPADLLAIRRYVAWVAFRRRMNNEFYFLPHWLGNPGTPSWLAAPARYHWI